MNNLNSIVDYLKVFNNINKRPAYEPRTMAHGGRIGLSDGQLVRNTADGSRPGYGGKGSSSPGYRANLLENLPDGYLDDYKANFYNTIKDGKLTHVGGAQPPSVKGSLKKGIPYMMEKYGENYGKIKDINSALKASFQSQIESGAKMGYNIRIGQLRAVAPWNPKAPKGMELHHFLPKLGIEGTDINFASTRNTAFISKELNRKMSPYDTKLKRIQLEQIKLLENKPKGWETEIERLNERARGIYKNAAKEVPGSAGYLGFSEIKIKPDGGYTVEIRGIDYNKSLSGIDKADEIFYRDPKTFEPISRENRLKVNKMSNIKSTNVLGKNFKDVVNNSKKGGALLTHEMLNKSKKFKGTKICKTDFASGGGGLCGKAFAEADPQGYLNKVAKIPGVEQYLKSKDGLTLGRSLLDNARKIRAGKTAARIGSFAAYASNPLTLLGGEAWYSWLAGRNEWTKGASLGEAVNEGLWFIPGKHSRDLDTLLGKDRVTKEGRNLPVISEGDRANFDLLTEMGVLINKEGSLQEQLFGQQWETQRLEDLKAKRLYQERFEPTKIHQDPKYFENLLGDIKWSKDVTTPDIEKKIADVTAKGEDVYEKWKEADPEGESYGALDTKIRDYITDKFHKKRTWTSADPYSGEEWNWIKRNLWERPVGALDMSEKALLQRQKKLDELTKDSPNWKELERFWEQETGGKGLTIYDKKDLPPELIENFLTKFPEYNYIFEGAEGGIASLIKKK